MLTRIVPDAPPAYQWRLGLHTWIVIVGDVVVVVSHAWYKRNTPFPKPVNRELGVPNAMVSLVQGVKPVTAAVVNSVQLRGNSAGRVTASVTVVYSLMGVPPPTSSEPPTSEVALTVPLIVWFPLRVLLPVVKTAPGSLIV